MDPFPLRKINNMFSDSNILFWNPRGWRQTLYCEVQMIHIPLSMLSHNNSSLATVLSPTLKSWFTLLPQISNTVNQLTLVLGQGSIIRSSDMLGQVSFWESKKSTIVANLLNYSSTAKSPNLDFKEQWLRSSLWQPRNTRHRQVQFKIVQLEKCSKIDPKMR